MGNLKYVTLEILGRLFTKPVGLSLWSGPFVAPLLLFTFVLQILGEAVWVDKGHDCKWSSVDRHNRHPDRQVLPLLPDDSTVRNPEVNQQHKAEPWNHRHCRSQVPDD